MYVARTGPPAAAAACAVGFVYEKSLSFAVPTDRLSVFLNTSALILLFPFAFRTFEPCGMCNVSGSAHDPISSFAGTSIDALSLSLSRSCACWNFKIVIGLVTLTLILMLHAYVCMNEDENVAVVASQT